MNTRPGQIKVLTNNLRLRWAEEMMAQQESNSG